MATETPPAAPAHPRRGAWPALAASIHREQRRVPFAIDSVTVGSVAEAHIDALRAWPQALRIDAGRVQLLATDRDAALAQINAAMREQGLIRAWRGETFAIVTALGAAPLALIERASARFWGSLTFGAHANGYVANDKGRPTHLWIARRSPHKATDPGRLDNLVGGGVPHGQTPFETLVREGFEEAGLPAEVMRSAVPGRVLTLACDIAEGFMHEQLHTFDLRLPADTVPVNQDGEVAELHCLPVGEAIALASGAAMTVDAALVTLDFALRHRMLPAVEHAWLAGQLRVAP